MIFTGKLIGERIYLRSLTADDATQTYANWLCDPQVNRFLATKQATQDELRAYIDKKNSQSDTYFFGIFLSGSDQHIGTIKLEPIDLTNRVATIAVMIGDKTCWGKGYNPEAMRLLINFCFQELGLVEMNLGVRGQHLAAIRSYEKLGFREVKRELNAIRDGDMLLDQVTMVLKKADFLS